MHGWGRGLIAHSTTYEKDTVPLMYKATNLCDFSTLFLWSLCAFADTTLFTFTWVLTKNSRGPQCRSSLWNRLTEVNSNWPRFLNFWIHLMSVTWGLLCHTQSIRPLMKVFSDAFSHCRKHCLNVPQGSLQFSANVQDAFSKTGDNGLKGYVESMS